MFKRRIVAEIVASAVAVTVIATHVMKKKSKTTTYKADIIHPIPIRRMGFYEKYIKRVIDIVCASGAIVVFSPLYIFVALLVRIKIGTPVLFTQDRPGLIGSDGKETVFKMYKFRSMTNERDENGELLPDEVRLTKFGAWLRNSSLDELPEVFNILNGTMSIIGPRPQLVRDMVFMTDDQRRRHTAKPGLSGLAQVNGRNAISWNDKIDWDLKYIEKCGFFADFQIVVDTIKKAFIKQEGITQDDMVTAEDFGDYLLRIGEISKEEYNIKQKQAKMILNGDKVRKKNLEDYRYTVSMCVYGGDNAEWFETAVNSVLKQSIPPDEIVLVVDGPVPRKLDNIISSFEKIDFFKVIRLKKNLGHGMARKTGLNACKTELVAIMDADDICAPDRFEKQIKAFKNNPDADIVGGMITEFIDIPDNIVGKRIVPLNDTEIKKYMKKRCPMNLVTVMFRKSSIDSVGGFIDWYCEEDYYLWLRMALANMKFVNVEDNLVNVRVGKEMYQRRGGIKYFRSEAKLQGYMLKNNIIRFPRYLINVSERLVLQVLMPNKVRGFIFQKLARSK